jgi:5-formyltetrahydrofolate cyclo-ligase
LVLVPLLGFDATGQRLGWGKGYYDRYLAHRLTTATATVPRPRAVGIAFAGQQVARIPSEPHDQRLDLVLTERGPVSS